MSLTPAFIAILENNLSSDEQKEVLATISSNNSVISANFTNASRSNVLVMYSPEKNIESRVKKIPGVKKILPLI